MTDATMEVKTLLESKWDPTKVVDRNDTQVLTDTPTIHTGAYDRDGPKPVIAISGKDEGPTSGGQTGLYGLAASGLGMQLIGGGLNIDFVAGTRADCKGVGTGVDTNPNPKKVRQSMYDHGAQLLLDHQRSTELRTIVPGDSREIEDSDDGPTIYRIQCRAQFLYERDPTPTA